MLKITKIFIHSLSKFLALVICAFLFLLIITACENQPNIPLVNVAINDNEKVIMLQTEIGTTVQSILASQNISLNQFDKVSPDLFSVVTESITIKIIRVEEIFETEEISIPYEQQTVRNESLPEKQTILVQTGTNGVREITYRTLLENGNLISRSVVRQVDTILPKPEIIMIGIQSPFSPVRIEGTLAYISAGNAWIMKEDSANRMPLITTGDLDGRIFSLSDNGKWLLFTRTSKDPQKINELWLLNLTDVDTQPIYLKVDNIIHFAEWMPGYTLSVLVSTVEKREVAPGWQANNNLIKLTLGANGNLIKQENILESNSGGIYGWWGTSFKYSPDGEKLAFSRPDSIGLVDTENNELSVLQNTIPFQTGSEWAWVSPISWSPENQFIYFVDHQSDTLFTNSESSPFFNLKSINIDTHQVLTGPKNVGMFSSTSSSPISENNHFRIVFLQAIFPENSDTSRYRVMSMDRDGSNSEIVFPKEGNQGLDPQTIVWEPCQKEIQCMAGVLYQGNILLLDIYEKSSTQLTGDGLVTGFSWK